MHFSSQSVPGNQTVENGPSEAVRWDDLPKAEKLIARRKILRFRHNGVTHLVFRTSTKAGMKNGDRQRISGLAASSYVANIMGS